MNFLKNTHFYETVVWECMETTQRTCCGEDTNTTYILADIGVGTCGPGLCVHLSEYCTPLKSVTL